MQDFDKISPTEPLENKADTEDNTNEVILSNEFHMSMHVVILDLVQLKLLLVPALWIELKKRYQLVVGNKNVALKS